MIYSICGYLVEYEPRFSRLRDRSQKYLAENQSASPDFSLEITDSDIDAHIEKYPMDKDLAEYVVAGIKFYEEILSRGGFFLHSAAMCVDGVGFAFTGPCGAGKSTHATLWRKYFGDKVISINDDKPVVKIVDGTPYICGTPFSGKFDINANVMVPLCGISILCQHAENSISKVSASQALPVLLEQTLRPEEPQKMMNLFNMLDETLSKVPVYKLCCNISREAVEVSYNNMKPH
ncbi:MAG: hypothetical protein IJC86_03580 [Clostridia bacterium]|nr:hypothetical protein [Clostridia bacterium]